MGQIVSIKVYCSLGITSSWSCCNDIRHTYEPCQVTFFAFFYHVPHSSEPCYHCDLTRLASRNFGSHFWLTNECCIVQGSRCLDIDTSANRFFLCLFGGQEEWSIRITDPGESNNLLLMSSCEFNMHCKRSFSILSQSQLIFTSKCTVKTSYLCLQMLGILCQASCRCRHLCLILTSVGLVYIRKLFFRSTFQVDLHITIMDLAAITWRTSGSSHFHFVLTILLNIFIGQLILQEIANFSSLSA